MYNNFRSKSMIHMILMALVIIGSINWGAHALGYNMVDMLSKVINNLFKSDIPINNIIYFIVAAAGLMLVFKRSTWLPFLGSTVFPESLVPLKQPLTTNLNVPIKTLPNVKIAYWAALNKGDKTNVYDAYGNHENSGVVMSDNNGNATLSISVGTGYTLPSGQVLPRHIHYRIVGYKNLDKHGIMGKINTVNY